MRRSLPCMRQVLSKHSSPSPRVSVVAREDDDDGYSIYVDYVNGNDNNPGTLASPLKTVSAGVLLCMFPALVSSCVRPPDPVVLTWNLCVCV